MMLSEDPESTEKKERDKYVSFKMQRPPAAIPEDDEEDFVSPMKGDGDLKPSDSLRKKEKLELIMRNTESTFNNVNNLFSQIDEIKSPGRR